MCRSVWLFKAATPLDDVRSGPFSKGDSDVVAKAGLLWHDSLPPQENNPEAQGWSSKQETHPWEERKKKPTDLVFHRFESSTYLHLREQGEAGLGPTRFPTNNLTAQSRSPSVGLGVSSKGYPEGLGFGNTRGPPSPELLCRFTTRQ